MNRLLRKKWFFEAIRTMLVLMISLLIGFILTVFVSDEPIEAYKALLFGPLTKFNRFADWIEESITLVFLGLSISIVFRANLFSLGSEGQLVLGALASGIVALYVPVDNFWRVTLALLAAMAVGFIWGVIPGYLKAKLKANEIVSTLMLNTIAIKIFDYILIYFLKPEKAPRNASEPFPVQGIFPSVIPNLSFLDQIRMDFENKTNITTAFYIMVFAIILTAFYMFKHPKGYELRMVGINRKFAEYGGINSIKTTILTMGLGGVLAGLAGAHLSLGIHRKLVQNMSIGLGFDGVLISLLARNNPLLIPITAFAYGYLKAGADIMERTSDVAREMVVIIQAIIILLITAERLFPSLKVKWLNRRHLRKEMVGNNDN